MWSHIAIGALVYSLGLSWNLKYACLVPKFLMGLHLALTNVPGSVFTFSSKRLFGSPTGSGLMT